MLYGWHGVGTGSLQEKNFLLVFSTPDPSIYDGYILERELPDERAELTVRINFHNFPATILCYELNMDNIFDGLTMSGTFIFKFILPSPDYVIPNLYNIFRFHEVLSFSIHATGTGTFSDEALVLEITPGATGRAHIIEMAPVNALVHNNLEYFFPVEMINIHEVGSN